MLFYWNIIDIQYHLSHVHIIEIWLLLLFSCLVVSVSSRPHEPQHTRPPCPSPTPRVYSNSCPLSQWCHPTISSSVVPLSSHLQSFLGSRSFPISQLFASGDQSIGASTLATVLPMNIQSWFPLGLTGLISFAVQETLKGLLQHHSLKASILWQPAFLIVQLSQPYVNTGETIALTIWTFVSKVMTLIFNILSRFVIAFLQRRKGQTEEKNVEKI